MFDVGAAQRFLLRSFDPSVSLVREAPNVAPSTFWVWNDNYLAMLALSDNPISSILRGQVLKQMPSRVAVLGGQTFDPQVILRQVTVRQVLVVGDKFVRTEVPDPTKPPLNPYDYADVAFYDTINAFNRGNRNVALTNLNAIEQNLWDGVGWRDKSWNGLYATYKCALYLITLNLLAVEGMWRTQNETAITRAQVFNRQGFANQNGAIMTEYDQNGMPNGDVNVETGALCVQAFRYR